ncbi:hypothetical protein V6N13_038453 [Hibiscus sabdariffa]
MFNVSLKYSSIDSLQSPYLDAIDTAASQSSGVWMRLDAFDPKYICFHKTNELSTFLPPNIYIRDVDPLTPYSNLGPKKLTPFTF